MAIMVFFLGKPTFSTLFTFYSHQSYFSKVDSSIIHRGSVGMQYRGKFLRNESPKNGLHYKRGQQERNTTNGEKEYKEI